MNWLIVALVQGVIIALDHFLAKNKDLKSNCTQELLKNAASDLISKGAAALNKAVDKVVDDPEDKK